MGNSFLSGDFQRFLISAVFLALLIALCIVPWSVMAPDSDAWMNVESNPLPYAFLQLALTLPILFANRPVLQEGIKKLRQFTADSDALASICVASCLVASLYAMARVSAGDSSFMEQLYFLPIGLLLTLDGMGRCLEALLQEESRRSFRELPQHIPRAARVTDVEGEHNLPLEKLRPGDYITVKTGETLPVDGVIVDESAVVDEKLFTGKPVNTNKFVGDEVYAGSVNRGEPFRYRAVRIGQDARLARMARHAGQASEGSVCRAQLPDARIAYLPYGAILLAVLAAVGWFFFGMPLDFLAEVFLAVLIVACAAPLSLCMPLPIGAALRKGLRQGIFLRDERVWEAMPHLDTVVFSRTGVLTSGQPTVTDVQPEGLTPDTLISLAASAERESTHPLGRAIIEYAERKRIRIQRASAHADVPGKGVEALLHGAPLRVGKRSWLKEQKISISARLINQADQFSAKGRLPVYFSTGNDSKGIIALMDPLRAEAREAMRDLSVMQLDTILLTSSGKRVAQAARKALRLSDVRADILPEAKTREIRLLQTHGHTVAMLGHTDGDADALIQADMGIATIASDDQAMENASVVLIHNDLRHVAKAIQIGRQAMRQAHGNARWMLFWGVLGLVPALGLLHPLGGPMLDPLMVCAIILLGSLPLVSDLFRFWA